MLLADVQFYNVVLFFHITAIVLAFGPTFSYAMFFAFAGKDPRAVPAVAKAASTWDRTVGTGGAVLAIITGIYMVSDSPSWDFSTFFVSWGFLAIIVIVGMVHSFFIPKTRELGQMAEKELDAAGGKLTEFSPEFDKLATQLNKLGPVVGIVILLTIYVMSAKPFL